MITIENLTVRYRKHIALQLDSLTMPPGMTYVLGANGAGKTTLFRVLSTQRSLRAGRLSFCDGDGAGLQLTTASPVSVVAKLRRNIGYLPQRFSLLEWSSVRQNVEYAAWAQGMAAGDIAEAAERAILSVGLYDKLHARCRSLSGGMRQRLGIACATVHSPSVVLLDEPTVGLDPAQRKGFLDYCFDLAQDRHVLLSTHILTDVRLDHGYVVVLVQGRLAFCGSVDEFMSHADPASPEAWSAYSRICEHHAIASAAS